MASETNRKSNNLLRNSAWRNMSITCVQSCGKVWLGFCRWDHSTSDIFMLLVSKEKKKLSCSFTFEILNQKWRHILRQLWFDGRWKSKASPTVSDTWQSYLTIIKFCGIFCRSRRDISICKFNLAKNSPPSTVVLYYVSQRTLKTNIVFTPQFN